MRSIPLSLLKTMAELYVPQEVGRWGNKTNEIIMLKRTHLQATSSVKRTRDSREVVLRALLFYDVRNSLPRGVDFDNFKTQADEVGEIITLSVNGLSYTVETVEGIPDDNGRIHHYELGLT